MYEDTESIKDDSSSNSRQNQHNNKPSATSTDQNSIRQESIIEHESTTYIQTKFATPSQQSRRASIKLAKSRFSKASRKLAPEHILILRKKFIKSVNLVVKCISWCKWAYKKNNELRDQYLSFSQLFDFELEAEKEKDQELLEAASKNPNVMYFNKDYYKAKKSDRKVLGGDIKDLLAKRSDERTKNEIETLRIVFKNNKTLASLPNEMQIKIFKKCWLEVFEPKRVVIRQGHSPAAFYFIISGSLVVTNLPEDSKTSYTICFLDPGQSFGELALLSRSLRTSTVITRNRVELLVIGKDDFYRVFGSEKTELLLLNTEKSKTTREYTEVDPGELSNIHFLKRLKFLKGWSFDSLAKNTTQLLFSYFPRGQVLVRHGNSSKYVYIVKKGTISVWIKITRPKNKFNDPGVVRKYLSMKNPDEGFEEDNNVNTEAHKNSDVAIISKLGNSTSYFVSDDYLKDQHHEAIGSVKHDDKKKEKKTHHHLTKEEQDTKNRVQFLMDYIAMTKGTIAKTADVIVSKGEKVMPGVVDKRDKLKILETKSEKDATFVDDNLSDIVETRSLLEQTNQQNDEELVKLEDKTFSKGFLHLPKITVEKVSKRKSVNSLTGSIRSRKGSMYIAKLPPISRPFKSRKSFAIPKQQYKTTIELMESDEANDNDGNYFKTKKKLPTITPVFQSSTPFANLPTDGIDFKPTDPDNEFITEYIEVQILESGSQFGLNEILFESQPDMTLISNGCDCILLPKEMFIHNATTSYIRDLRKQIIPYPKFNEILKTYNEFSSWQKYSSKLAKEVIVNTKRYLQNEKFRKQIQHEDEENYMLKSSFF